MLVGRTRNADDRVQWLIGQGRWDAALVLAESAGREVKPETFDQVLLTALHDIDRCICFLCRSGGGGAARMSCVRFAI